jgi:hypothetical protein
MVSGEGISLFQVAGAALVVGAGLAAFVWFMDQLEQNIQGTLTIGPLDTPPALTADGMAEALVPEYAAARRRPIGDECGCRACRRPTEPCSDFDGD